MKIAAVIKPFRLDNVKESLVEMGVMRMTVSGVRGFGRQNGHFDLYLGAGYVVELVPKIKTEVALPAKKANCVVEVITRSARTGSIGDGRILVLPVSDAVRIRTGESGVVSL